MSFLVASPTPWEHPSYYPVGALVDALRADGHAPVPVGPLLGKVAHRLRFRPPSVRRRPILVPLMGPVAHQLAGAALRGRPAVFAWDVWENSVDEWLTLLEDHRVRVILCTSSAARELLMSRGFPGAVFYVPEATVVSDYRSGGPLADRPIQVLELGRRYDAWHESVQAAGVFDGVEARFERSRGQIVFADREALVDGFASSAISVCFPKSMTHPREAGRIETFTHRYLESMASGCLIVGHAPPDLTELFGYNPVVEADVQHAGSQLQAILGDLAAHQDLVDRNLQTVRRVGDWSQRARDIGRILSSHA